MSGSVTLNAAMRANLLSLQNTADLMAQTQQRIATGKKVNSALDNPTSFFAAQSLTYRAGDLSNLLDGMGQAIQTIQAANQGITGAQSLVQQMQAVANSALQGLTTTNAAVTNGGTTAAPAIVVSGKTGTAATVTASTYLGAIGEAGASGTAIPNTSTTMVLSMQAPGSSTVSTTTITMAVTSSSSGNTMQDLLNALNNVNGISATFTSTTGDLSISAINGDSITISGALAASATGLGLGTAQATATSAAPSASYISQFDTLKTQLDQLVQDSSYQGVNLISSSTNSPLTITFNEAATNANKLTINAVDVTSTGLGLTAATSNWTSAASINTSISQLTTANTTLRTTASNLGTNLTTVQTRQTFTTNLINTLQSGASQLTNADVNQESANMLALQTQQQLGTSSLALASQAAQAVLKLFP